MSKSTATEGAEKANMESLAIACYLMGSGRCGDPKPTPKRVVVTSPENIEDLVCARLGVALTALRARGRAYSVAWARHVVFWLLSKHTMMSFTEIGQRYGRTPGAVRHGVQRLNGLMGMGKRDLSDSRVALRSILTGLEEAVNDG